MTDEAPWWKEAVFYHVYPRSFNDSDGDGVGDLPGVLERVDYFAELGVDAVWLSPVYASPNVDNGYDVSDYREISAELGTMNDFDRLVEALHERDVKLVMDMVLNHTSDEHPWFVESRRSSDAEHRDYYFWREGGGDDGSDPPNNWRSVWGGSAWTRDERTGEHYLHLFHEKQAELNWENPAVREELFEIVEWWLERGVDGFRLDSVNLVSKPEGLPDADPEEGLTGLSAAANGSRVPEFLRELCERIPEEAVTIGEMPDLTVEEASRYVGGGDDELSMLLSFEHVELDRGAGARWAAREWELRELKGAIERWQTGLEDGGWQGLYLNNHDQPRAVSRFGDDGVYRRESATMLAAMLFTLRGTPFVYQGEEIAMADPRFESFEEIRDVATRRSVEHAVEEGAISGFEEVKDLVNRRTRDNARTPMRWTDGPNAGFTDGDPWIKLGPDVDEVNVERAREDPDSVWHQYRRLIELRKEHSVLVHGSFRLVDAANPKVFGYLRACDDERALVALNFADGKASLNLPADVAVDRVELAFCNYADSDRSHEGGERSVSTGSVELRPYEARIYLSD